MKKTLSRELGIFSLISIACGAMVSGLLVLPAYAAKMTGPSVFLAFLLAGILFLPATFSKCEMATAIPESGGDYLVIDRSLGPFFSTISGLGMFFTLTMKSAFALAGFGAYLLVVMPFPDIYAQVAGIGVAALIILINYRGAKKSGTVQQVLFIITVLALLGFMVEGSLWVNDENLRPALTGGWSGFFSATAFVFVSYAGVTKIASVAEEVKNPGRMIPVGMLVSLGIMVFLYVIVVYVMVGNVPVEEFFTKKGFKDAPLALAGLKVAGKWGMYFLAGVSALALIAMANAGILASSRYPFALSRYKQLPDFINRIHPEFSTPSVSILITGIILILSITFLPVVQLAKLASAFKLIVLGMLNCALIILRESNIEWYQPEFRSPFYPYVQLFGIFASLFLICFLGILSIVCSLGLVLFASGWYYLYVRNRVGRKGAIFQSADVDADDLELFERARSPSSNKKESVIVPFFDLENIEPVKIERRLRLAASLCAEEERLDLVNFIEIAEQSMLSEFEDEESHLDLLEERAQLLRNEIDNEIHVDQVVTHNSRGALLNYAREEKPHWVLFSWKEPSPWQILIGIQEWWLEDFPCDSLFLKDNDNPNFENLLVVSAPGPYDGEILYAANHIANYFDGQITFLNPVDESDEESVEFFETYQNELKKMVDCETDSDLVPQAEWNDRLIEASIDFDLILTGGEIDDSFFGQQNIIPRNIVNQIGCNFARIRSNLRSPQTVMSVQDKTDEVDISDFFQESGSVIRVTPTNKKELFENIAISFADSTDGADEIEEKLWDRESLQNTYVENGVAFPHGIIEGLPETQIRFVMLDDPIEYTSSGDSVSLCVATVGPPDDRETHLQVLRQMAGLFVGQEIKDKLMKIDNYDGALEIMENHL